MCQIPQEIFGRAFAPNLPKPPINQSFFASFCSQKEVLSSFFLK
jgi:hypothetical protein